ncbi:hypothetical protein P175DRAFT_0511543 [Aspergillus ochraceoroseus IBT 24754]|uniref:Autophagy-related protein 2 n=1 Tax=Aspergillus ochraceoroseus IBT 24754 TaxID=1392256 RepID=A0A2T5LP78_9EURO|nr:uncharacterized protein P175DRAFT_0511543 [Aspergillus ochraceoroseus IBT 24754]PTU18094.1 hypothetical protein P175DRAFT_0511543 [Aspergillus ochraceoroseus IBT 24754]
MAYFLPWFFQKRLLRYALSRLELVDTEALDLDSLGIRWGQRSTVELRDIGLQLEKLATLLRLPSSSELLSARVRYLKLTVPADIYSSGIICEASGIDVHLRLPSEEACVAKDSFPAGHEQNHESIIPDPTDLAESFLQAEPKEEKEELQAAITTQSQVLHRTSTAIGDEEEELGLGNESVSLPSFVAAFLKGVVDRFQIQVDDISIRVDVETKQEGSSKRQPEEKPDLITGLLSVRQVTVGAVSAVSSSDELPLHRGKRPVSLSDINLALVSEPVVFSNYSRFTVPASPSTAVASKPSQSPSRASSPAPPPSSISSSTHALMRSTIFEPPHDLAGPMIGEHSVPKLEESVYTYDGRFSDADTDDETRSYRYLEESHNSLDDERLFDNPAYLDSVIDSHLQDDDIEGLDDLALGNANSHNTYEYTPRLQSSEVGYTASTSNNPTQVNIPEAAASEPNIRRGMGHLLGDRTTGPQSSMPTLSLPTQDFHNNDIQESRRLPASPSEASNASSASSYFNNDLSESKLFSNEEAQSMYMSAMSQDSTSRSFMPNIPGAWDSSESTVMREENYHNSSGIVSAEHDDIDQAEHDETTVSTPKLTAQDATHSSQHTIFDETYNFHPEPAERPSTPPSPSLNRIRAVAKRFFKIEEIRVWIPSSKHEGEHAESPTSPHSKIAIDSSGPSPEQLGKSEALGDAVSTSKFPSSLRYNSDPADLSFAAESSDPKHAHHTSDDKKGLGSSGSDNEIAVEISSVEIHFDISIGWLVTKFGQRILQAFGGDGAANISESSSQKDVQKPQSFSLALGTFSIKFVEHVPGNAYPLDEHRPYSTTFLDFLHDDIILQTTASGLKANFLASKDITKFSLEVSKFTLGFASEDLISFSEDLKMRESTRDILSPIHGDISLSLSQTLESARLNVTTLPLQICLNIQRLEEVLGWFGGLSSIMELGSSISSISGTKGLKKDVLKRPRGVHFEAASSPVPAPERTSTPWKVNARIGGIALDVAGESHYLKLRTTAAKIVSRFEGIALQIDKAKLSGPLPLDDSRDAPAKINLNSIRVEYLFIPKEPDLDRLLALITPSKDKYDEDDDIMLDTLFRQRKQGSVLRVTVTGANASVSRTSDLDSLSQLGDELSRLSNVAKYLPEDDRPGILTLVLIRELEAHLHVGGKVGNITAQLQNAEAAHISLPSLVAAQLGSIRVVRNDIEELVGEAVSSTLEQTHIPVFMARFIADEMDPTFKVKLHNLRVEYTLPSMTAFLGISEEMTSGDVAANMATSLANLAELHPPSQQSSNKKDSPASPAKPTKLAVAMRGCIIGLNPRGTAAKGLVVLTHANFSGTIHDPSSSEAILDLRKASIMIIDDVKNSECDNTLPPGRAAIPRRSQIQCLMDLGYVSVSTISSATATVKIMRLSDDGTKSLDVELRDDLLILETCADSTQTLISIINGLQPPTPPSVAVKYRTEVIPIQDMLASFTGDAFTTDLSEEAPEVIPNTTEIPTDDELEYVSDFYPVSASPQHESSNEGNELLDSFHSQYYVSSSVSELEFRDDHFAQQSAVGGTAHRWDSAQNTYGLSDDLKLQKSPLRVRVRDAHVIWNLFDGYDWQRTRDTISKAVKDVEKKATERRARVGSRASPGFDDEGSVIGDCLFNSIYIGIPANKDPREIRGDINRNIDDLVSETGSYATTTTVTGATVRQSHSPSLRGKKLRLSRSKYHKMTFELKGICADLVVFPPDSGETQSSVDVRVKDLEIFDHVPTSTWKKFATYMHEAGEKESGTSMVHLEILTVRPVPELAASEIVLKATILPLRLHVDQDALDFLTRFFEFRDDSTPTPGTPAEIPFLQRVEISAVPVKLDFKPKRVDYAGLRSGRTTEFMNFFVLDEADMVMRHVILYGVSGFDKLGQTLNDIWMPDIKRNQLPGVLSGLAPIRSLVNVGGGVKDLVVVPMREYRKDGRIVRSIQKGALAFAKTTSNELVKLGAKLAIGTQTVLQGAEEILTTSGGKSTGNDEDQGDEETGNKISLYADQPVGVVQGLRGAFRGLERDLLLARDAIIAVPGEVAESSSAKDAAKAVLRRTPTVILRPAIGVSKAVGQTLLGAGNSLDPSNRRKMEDKYKRH